MNWRRGAVLFVLLLSAGCAVQPPQPEVRPDRDTTGGEPDQTARARIHTELAAGYFELGNMSVALEEAQIALRADPGYSPAHNVAGLIYSSLKEDRLAEQSFQGALRLNALDSDANNNYGWFLCQTGRERQSIERFQAALRNPLYPTPARPMHNAGICSLRLGDEAAAEGWFQRSFQADPRNPVAMYNLGEIYLKRRDLDRARFYTQRLTSGFEPTAQVLWLALRVERMAGNRDSEASLATQLRRRFPTSPEAALLAAGQYGG